MHSSVSVRIHHHILLKLLTLHIGITVRYDIDTSFCNVIAAKVYIYNDPLLATPDRAPSLPAPQYMLLSIEMRRAALTIPSLLHTKVLVAICELLVYNLVLYRGTP